MKSSEPAYPCVLGCSGFDGSHVSVTVCVRKSIHLLSAAESDSAVRRDVDVMFTVTSSRLMSTSEYLSLCCSSRLFVEPTIYDFVP